MLYSIDAFPFGHLAISFQGDYLAQYLPTYYFLWDVLHGYQHLDFTWELGLGVGLAGGVSHFYLLNPFLLVLFLFPRTAVPYAMELVYFLVLMTMAVGMNLFLNGIKHLLRIQGHTTLRVFCSIAYAYSLHSIMYMGMGWPITGMLIPFLMLFLSRVLKEETDVFASIGYLVTLTLVFCLNIPQAYAVCLYLVFFVGFISFYNKEKSLPVRNFIWLSILSLGISMCVFLPALINTSESHRFQLFQEAGGFLKQYHHKIAAEGLEAFRKVQMLQTLGPILLALIMMTVLYAKKKGDSLKKYVTILSFNVLVLIPLVIEVVNIMWNDGPYICFPVRHGYLLYFTVIATFYYVMETLPGKKVYCAIIGASVICWLVYTIHYCDKYIAATNPELVLTGEARETNSLERVRMSGRDSAEGMDTLRYAYPMIGNYYPLNTTAQLEANQVLGYQQEYVRLSDQGGTVFSDLLMNITGVLEQNGNVTVTDIKLSFPLYISEDNYRTAIQMTTQDEFAEQDRITSLVFGKTCNQLEKEGLKKNIEQINQKANIEVAHTEIKAELMAPNKGYALISAYAGAGWNYTVNGRQVDSEENPYQLMLIPVEPGDNVIEAKWSKPGGILGVTISILAAIAAVAIFASGILRKEILIKPIIYSYAIRAAFVFFLLYIYVVPILYRMLRLIKNIL